VAVAVALLLTASHLAQAAQFGYSNEFGNPGFAEPFATCLIQSRVPCRTAREPSLCARGDCLELSPPYASRLFDLFVNNTLRAGSSTAYVRLSVPYDALLTSSTHGRFVPSTFATEQAMTYQDQTATQVFNELVWDVQGGESLGLSPDVKITAGTGLNDAEFPDPLVGSRHEDISQGTRAGLDYKCGIDGILSRIRALLGPRALSQWEAFDEPNICAAYNGELKGSCSSRRPTDPCAGAYHGRPSLCETATVDKSCGPLEASGLWEAFESVVTGQRFTGISVAAMTLDGAQDTVWERGYL
jgi:hypothetical protein